MGFPSESGNPATGGSPPTVPAVLPLLPVSQKGAAKSDKLNRQHVICPTDKALTLETQIPRVIHWNCGCQKFLDKPVPIGSMVLVYMLTWLGYIDGIHVTIYSIHGSYGVWIIINIKLLFVFLDDSQSIRVCSAMWSYHEPDSWAPCRWTITHVWNMFESMDMPHVEICELMQPTWDIKQPEQQH
jgi:hypothetical protein